MFHCFAKRFTVSLFCHFVKRFAALVSKKMDVVLWKEATAAMTALVYFFT
jgi:hypothetical protein